MQVVAGCTLDSRAPGRGAAGGRLAKGAGVEGRGNETSRRESGKGRRWGRLVYTGWHPGNGSVLRFQLSEGLDF